MAKGNDKKSITGKKEPQMNLKEKRAAKAVKKKDKSNKRSE